MPLIRAAMAARISYWYVVISTTVGKANHDIGMLIAQPRTGAGFPPPGQEAHRSQTVDRLLDAALSVVRSCRSRIVSRGATMTHDSY